MNSVTYGCSAFHACLLLHKCVPQRLLGLLAVAKPRCFIHGSHYCLVSCDEHPTLNHRNFQVCQWLPGVESLGIALLSSVRSARLIFFDFF